jgi:hypothetical protein
VKFAELEDEATDGGVSWYCGAQNGCPNVLLAQKNPTACKIQENKHILYTSSSIYVFVCFFVTVSSSNFKHASQDVFSFGCVHLCI